MELKQMIEKMTLEEKASLLSGENFWYTKAVERLGIPAIMLTDGPHGLRKEVEGEDHLGINKSIPATCFPPAATLANSWDEELLEDVGRALGRECLKEEVSVLLGPGLNLKRNPLCGRNFEYFSEDPYLSGKLAAAIIRGIEGMGVSACAKHFAVNSQEEMRMIIDEIVDERALRELYLEGFRIAVAEGKPGTIMTSYNKVNGTYANENQKLLQQILFEEWGYNGVVVTDWGGNNDRVEALLAGNQLEMPSSGGVTDREVVEAVKNGTISEELLDQRVESLLRWIQKAERSKQASYQVNYQEHHQQAVEAAEQSIVLLKNDDQLLPLTGGKSIAVIGDYAINPRFQGSGSSRVEPARLENTLSALVDKGAPVMGFSKGFNRFGGSNRSLRKEAVDLAGRAEIVLLFLGLDESVEAEGFDRKNLDLPVEQLKLLKEVHRVNPNIVAVLAAGAPVELPFDSMVKSILHGYLGGQGGAEALASLLLGEKSPCGKLAETYPLYYRDIPSSRYYPGRERTAEHRESIYVGYRYFDKQKAEVRYPFGHGLSYTEFEYADLDISRSTVRFTVKNSGAVAAAEVAQVYIHTTSSGVFRAEQELKGFQKHRIEPGEVAAYSIDLDDHAFAFYHVGEKRWVVEGGVYEIRVGASSRDIRLTGRIEVDGDDFDPPYAADLPGAYLSGKVQELSSADFAKLFGKPMPESSWDRKAKLGMNDTVAQAAYRSGAGWFLNGLLNMARKIYYWKKDPYAGNNLSFPQSMTYRQLYRFSMGRVSKKKMENYLILINHGLLFGALRLLFSGLARNHKRDQ